MYRWLLALVAVVLLSGVGAHTQTPTPFKLGTFARQGRPFVGVVLDGTRVIDLAVAHAAIRTPASTLTSPTDMKDLIARYDTGWRQRIGEIVAAVQAAGANRPTYVFDLGALTIQPPIMYPTTMLNVAVNYREHDVEMVSLRDAAPGQTTPTSGGALPDRKSTRLNSSHIPLSRMPSSA